MTPRQAIEKLRQDSLTCEEQYEIADMFENATNEVEARDALGEVRLRLYRGQCGHHWIPSESTNCPVCRREERIK